MLSSVVRAGIVCCTKNLTDGVRPIHGAIFAATVRRDDRLFFQSAIVTDGTCIYYLLRAYAWNPASVQVVTTPCFKEVHFFVFTITKSDVDQF